MQPDLLKLTVSAHPHLDLRAFVTRFPGSLSTLTPPDWLSDLRRLDAPAPLVADDAVRAAVRDLLRHGGYKPTGRGKPASEYLIRAVSEGQLGSINLAVDVCNVVSLHSGLPISVVDLDRAVPPLAVDIAGAGEQYVFNTGGQVIDVEGLLGLRDAGGPCANAVKDAQRTKTSGDTVRTLSLIWGTRALGDRSERTAAWYRELLHRLGTETEAVAGS